MKRFSNRDLRRLMKKAGIEVIETPELEYIEFLYKDGRRTRIYNPTVSKMKIGGQTTYQVIGEEEEVEEEIPVEFDEEDIKMVMEQADVDRELAIKALQLTNGDIAQAIIILKEGEL
jgi:nascent polypeptide-associated complex subunit alpha